MRITPTRVMEVMLCLLDLYLAEMAITTMCITTASKLLVSRQTWAVILSLITSLPNSFSKNLIQLLSKMRTNLNEKKFKAPQERSGNGISGDDYEESSFCNRHSHSLSVQLNFIT
ncbi:hypothetical protein NQ318_012834 [Aromia moschata]|uniref:Uncharacterized protein n=1 Tax=Aromia moschata TaxID=1265417 RepID=A0AAV8X3B2_9CUCU|nr:hypothetical protein NQ318_012834 [Aromia moschata]